MRYKRTTNNWLCHETLTGYQVLASSLIDIHIDIQCDPGTISCSIQPLELMLLTLSVSVESQREKSG